MATKTLSVVVAGDASKARKMFTQLGDDADDMGGRLSKVGDKISPGLAAAAGAVVAGVGLMLKSAFDAADESAKIGRETERVLRTTGATAWTSADQVGDYAQQLAELTGVDDEVIQSGENMLLTFTRVQNKVGQGNDVFNRASKAALDMSTVMGTDMQSSAVMLGKALNDPLAGITKLTKAGVTFDDQQKAQIKTMVAAGDVLGAQKIILQEVEKEFGGAAEAAGTPLDKLKVKIGNLQEQMGGVLIPIVSSAADKISFLTEGFAALPGPVQAVVAGMGALTVGGSAGIVVVAKLASVASDVLGPALKIGKGLLDDAALGAANLATKFGVGQDSALKLASGVSGVGAALPIVGAAALAGVAIWTMYTAEQEAAKKRAKEFTDTLNEQTGAVTDNTVAKIRSDLEDNNRIDNLNKAKVSVEQYSAAVSDSSAPIMERRKFLDQWIESEKNGGDIRSDLINQLRQEGGARNDLLAALIESGAADKGLIDQIYEESSAYDANIEAVKQRTIQQSISKGATLDQAQADAQAAAAALRNADAIKAATEATQAAVNPYFAASKAVSDLKEAQVNAYLAGLQYKNGSPEVQAANERVAEAAMNTEAAYMRLAEQMQRNGSTSDDMKAAFQRWVEQGSITQAQADQLVSKFGILGAFADDVSRKNVTIETSAPGADRVISQLSEVHRRMLDIYNTTGSAGQRSIGGISANDQLSAFLAGLNKGYASGGSVSDGWFTVGENGPEIGRKTGSNVEIFSNPESTRMLASAGSGGMTVIVNMPPGSNGDDVVEAIKRYERLNGTAWRN